MSSSVVVSIRSIQFAFAIFHIADTREYSLIWGAKGTTGKVLFFCVRYPVPVSGILYVLYEIVPSVGTTFCKADLHISVWAGLVFFVPLQIIVILRTMALWQDKRIARLLIVAFIVTDVVSAVTLARLTHLQHVVANSPLEPLLACIGDLAALRPSSILPALCAMITFDSLIFILTLVKAVHTYYSERDILLRVPLRAVLMRDGFLYIAVMLSGAVLILVVSSTLKSEDIVVVSGASLLQQASYSIVGSRLMLNVRDVNMQQVLSEGTSPTRSLPWRVRTIRTAMDSNIVSTQLGEDM